MMDYWKHDINGILANKKVEDVAIVGFSDNKCVGAAKPGGLLTAISSQEVSLITGQDRKMFLLSGITVADKKCTVIRDSLLVDEDNAMDVRSKGSDSRSGCIGKPPRP
ncbi:profilin-3-like [Rhynochetos jubatus]